MEIEGHPSQDLLDELERRGATYVRGTSSGPRVDAIARFNEETGGDVDGIWLFLPREVFDTGLDEAPF